MYMYFQIILPLAKLLNSLITENILSKVLTLIRNDFYIDTIWW